jgi:hypothetical protein
LESSILSQLKGEKGFPKIYRSGVTEEGYGFIVMEKLGSSLKFMLDDCNKIFTLKDVV